MAEHTIFEWICLALALPFVALTPMFILAPFFRGLAWRYHGGDGKYDNGDREY